jgi:hypothetical protein
MFASCFLRISLDELDELIYPLSDRGRRVPRGMERYGMGWRLDGRLPPCRLGGRVVGDGGGQACRKQSEEGWLPHENTRSCAMAFV